MRPRSGLHMVPTTTWYIERTVWLVAGIVLLAGTALAAFVDPRWAVLIIATGVASVAVALTGFCVVGNMLQRLGFAGRLADGAGTGRWYLMQTDACHLERRIYLAVGINISIASVLSVVHTSRWLWFTGFAGAAMVWLAATGFGRHGE